MASAVVRRRRRYKHDRRWRLRRRTVVVRGVHEAGVPAQGRRRRGRQGSAAAAAVHVAGRPEAERGRRATVVVYRVVVRQRGGRRPGPVQIAVRRTAGPGHALTPGRHTDQRPEQKACLVRAVSTFFFLFFSGGRGCSFVSSPKKRVGGNRKHTRRSERNTPLWNYINNSAPRVKKRFEIRIRNFSLSVFSFQLEYFFFFLHALKARTD